MDFKLYFCHPPLDIESGFCQIVFWSADWRGQSARLTASYLALGRSDWFLVIRLMFKQFHGQISHMAAVKRSVIGCSELVFNTTRIGFLIVEFLKWILPCLFWSTLWGCGCLVVGLGHWKKLHQGIDADPPGFCCWQCLSSFRFSFCLISSSSVLFVLIWYRTFVFNSSHLFSLCSVTCQVSLILPLSFPESVFVFPWCFFAFACSFCCHYREYMTAELMFVELEMHLLKSWETCNRQIFRKRVVEMEAAEAEISSKPLV